ncbi:MAG: hypothetical protein ACXVEE_11670 [Polyangiales bacterium]
MRWAHVVLVLLALGLVAPFSWVQLAWAQGDLKTEPTTKTGGEPTTKTGGEPTSKELTTGTVPPPKTAAPPKTAPVPSASESAAPSESAEPAPSASVPPPSPKGPITFAKRKVPLGIGDLAVTLSMPDGWTELPPESLPVPDEHPDVKVVARKGFGVFDPKGKPPQIQEIVVVCGQANGDYWADAIRDAAFTQMTAAIEKEAHRYSTVESINPEPIRTEGDKILQSFIADGDFAIDGKTPLALSGKGKAKAATSVKLQGLSFIGFIKEDPKASPSIIACSVACAHLVAEGETSLCPAAIGSIDIGGTFVPPPKRSFLAELFFKLKRDPTTLWLVVVGFVFLILFVVLGIVLVRRKRRTEQEAARAEVEEEAEDAAAVAAEIAAEIRATMQASPPPQEGFFDPQTLARRKA